jgi:hypothetical protein
MDKSAIFVDAGYLLARGGLVVCGTHRRSEFECTFEPLINALNDLAGDLRAAFRASLVQEKDGSLVEPTIS